MTKPTIILLGIIAIQHFYFLYLEMFLWNTPKGIKTFGLKSKQFADNTKVLAANQGLYNGFLAAGIIYTILNNNVKFAFFFLICVIVAGIYGAFSTKNIKLFYIQAVPAIITLIVLVLS